MLDRHVTHPDIVAFADERINLKREDVRADRDQVGRLRTKLETYIAAHPGFDLVKMLHSGSVAKGTALRTINDMDVAVYVAAGKAPEDEKKLIDWLSGRLQEAYGDSLKPEQFSPQHQCVTVSFRGSGLDVDVVPVLYEGGADDRGYLITKDTGDRVLTSIPLHLKFTRTRKGVHKRHYRQMVRLGDRQELIYLPLGDSRFDSDVVLGQSLRSFQSSLNLFHLFSGNPNAVAILAVEAFHGGVVTPPGHPQGALQNHLQAVQDHTVPFLFQGRPAAFDRIVLAVVGRIVHQA